MTTATNQDAQYFDLITEGIGYLNRVRTVKPNGKGKPYQACTIKAIVGPKDDVEYREFDVRVVGSQALAALATLSTFTDDSNNKIIVHFRVGDANPTDYTIQVTDPQTREKVPTKRYCNKGRLLQIMKAKVNGNPVELPTIEKSEEGSSDSSSEQSTGTHG